MRTHWEVSLEGKHVRDQWDADFEARVQCNEKEAADYWDGLSKKEKDWERGWMLGEHRNMKRRDRESKMWERRWNDLDQAFEEGIARLERRWGATNVPQGELLKGSWI